MAERGAVFAVAEQVSMLVRCRYQCSTWAALSGVDTSRLVRMNE